MLFSLNDDKLPHLVEVCVKNAEKGLGKTLYVGPSQKCEDWLEYGRTVDGGHATGDCMGLRKDKLDAGWSVAGIGPEPKPAKLAPPKAEAAKPAKK